MSLGVAVCPRPAATVTIGLSKRAGLRAGYGAVIVVLGLSAIEAYRIQISVSEQHMDIYRRYAAEEAELSSAGEELIRAIYAVQKGTAFFSPAVARIFQDGFARLKDASDVTDRTLSTVLEESSCDSTFLCPSWR